jgi:hypothetical protein
MCRETGSTCSTLLEEHAKDHLYLSLRSFAQERSRLYGLLTEITHPNIAGSRAHEKAVSSSNIWISPRITIRNMGVSHDNLLKLFDFGSIVHHGGEVFNEQSIANLHQIRNDLEQAGESYW